jgi:hypothetical protein
LSVATDLGKASARQDEGVPRPRGGAHSASKDVRLRRGASGPVPPPVIPSPRRTVPGGTAAGLAAAAVVVTVIPLVLVQVPDAIAWSLPARFAHGGPNTLASLLRAAGLALPVMAVAAPFGALATRRFRAAPVLLAGLLAIGAADVLGETARTVLLIGADRSLHGAGAGVSMAAVTALAAERRPAARSLAGWWACVTVSGLVAAPELMRYRITSGGWSAALHPYPWLTGIALTLTALYAMLAEGTATAAVRGGFPAVERAHLALLAAPVAGLSAICVAVTYRGDRAVVAAAIADVIALAGLTVVTARVSTAARFAVVCAVTGFTLAPAAGAVTALSQPAAQPGFAALAAALCGAALALASRTAPGRAITASGLFVAAASFGAAYLAGPFGAAYLAGPGLSRPGVLTIVCVPLAGGLAAALAASLRATTAGPAAAGGQAGGAVCGVVLLLAGVASGFLAAGAVQLHALADARTASAVHAALVAGASRWALAAAVVTATAGLALACATGRRAGPAGRRHAGSWVSCGSVANHHQPAAARSRPGDRDRIPGTQ